MRGDEALTPSITGSHAHVTPLEALPDVVRDGTVDRFNGREAPIEVYSMAASPPEKVPRAMAFLHTYARAEKVGSSTHRNSRAETAQ